MRPSLGTAAGPLSWITTTKLSAGSLRGFAVARSRRWTTDFSRPSMALLALYAAPLAIIERAHPLGMEVRSGLHTGEIEIQANDVGGIAVHMRRASRRWPTPKMCSCPAPCEIWYAARRSDY